MKISVLGAVSSTQVVVESLAKHNFTDVTVWGYSPQNVDKVSGWVDLQKVAKKCGFRFFPFTKVEECENEIRDYFPDILFVVGLSQIVPSSILDIPRFCAIGFHPTALPKGRGRAPIAWLILNESEGAATFFKMREGVDDGPILAQSFFEVTDQDDAKSLEKKITEAEKSALDVVITSIKNGRSEEHEQDHPRATWYGRRAPEDGWIDWGASAYIIAKLVRATTFPHPGAYTFAGDEIVRVWSAKVVDRPIIGVVGRIVEVDSAGGFLIQSGQGLLHISDWTCSGGWFPKVGARLGYYVELEVNALRSYLTELEARVAILEKNKKNI